MAARDTNCRLDAERTARYLPHSMSSSSKQDADSSFQEFRATLRHLYHGESRTALRFQFAIITVDLAIIAFFIVSPIVRGWPFFLWIDYSIAALIGADLVARALASRDVWRWLRLPTVWVDMFILLTLLMPYTLFNLGFLRVLRLWSVSRSGTLWRPLERRGYGQWRDVTRAVVNLLTFLLLVSGFVYTFFFRGQTGIEAYVDAIYYTVATVTTTGFGDIVLPGVWGKLTAIVTMIVGLALFFTLAQSVFSPRKVFHPCPQCALQRHDVDAVHCKACGHMLKIPDRGD